MAIFVTGGSNRQCECSRTTSSNSVPYHRQHLLIIGETHERLKTVARELIPRSELAWSKMTKLLSRDELLTQINEISIFRSQVLLVECTQSQSSNASR
jgi:hypothetical protein